MLKEIKAKKGDKIKIRADLSSFHNHKNHEGIVKSTSIVESFQELRGRYRSRKYTVMCECGKELNLRPAQFEVIS